MKKSTIEKVIKFRDDRDWKKFHTGCNLAKSIVLEASELLEVFQWSEEEKSIEKVKEELADVLTYCILMADIYNLDLDEIVNNKVDLNIKKYPVDKCYGSSKKYNELKDK